MFSCACTLCKCTQRARTVKRGEHRENRECQERSRGDGEYERRTVKDRREKGE